MAWYDFLFGSPKPDPAKEAAGQYYDFMAGGGDQSKPLLEQEIPSVFEEKRAPTMREPEEYSGMGSLKSSSGRAPAPTPDVAIKTPDSWEPGAVTAPDWEEQVAKAEEHIAVRKRQDQIAAAKMRLQGTIPKEVLDSGNDDEIAEAVLADYNRLLQHYPKDAPDVPNVIETPLRTAFGFLEGGGSAVGDTLQGAAKFFGVTGRLVEPATDRQILNRYREFLGVYDPEKLAQARANESLIAKYPESSILGGEVTESLVEGFAVGGAIVKTVRMAPALGRLRAAGRAGIYAANILENIAVSVGVNLEYGATRGRNSDEIARSIAANPSMLLPLSSKTVIAVGAVADYFAAKALGYSTQEAAINSALAAGGNFAQRAGLKSELADFDLKAAKEAFFSSFQGDPKLAPVIWQEAEALRSYAESNPQDIKGIIKMHIDGEKRVLAYKKQIEKMNIGENRTVGLRGDGAEPQLPKKIPTKDGFMYRAMSRDELSQIQKDGSFIPSAPEPGETAGKKYFDANPEAARIGAVPYGSDQVLTRVKVGDLGNAEIDTKMKSGTSAFTRDSVSAQNAEFSTDGGKSWQRMLSQEDLLLQATKETIKNADEAKASFEAYKKVSSQEIFDPAPKRSEVGKEKAETRQNIRSTIDAEEPPPSDAIRREMAPITEKAPALKKDLSGIEAEGRDFHRNIWDVFGKDSPEAKAILEPFDAAKGKFVDMQQQITKDLKTNVVDKGIKAGSKESAAIQTYGEASDKTAARAELVKKFGEKKAAVLVDAEAWFRKSYDTLIDQVNAARREIYPNNPEKIIPYRQDYFRHFRDISDEYRGLQALFETPAGIDPALAGISPYTRPKSKFLSFSKRRGGGETDIDAVGGFLDYLPSAARAIYIDPQVARIRALETGMRESMIAAKSPHLNRFLEYLNDFGNDIAGKTSAYDRPAQKLIGRKALNVIDWLNKRAKANTVIGNLSSSVAQIFNVPQGVSDTGVHAVPGMVRTLADIFVPNKPMAESSFLKERYGLNGLYDSFDRGMLKYPKKFAVWMTGVGDEIGTRFIWNSEYSKGMAKKVSNPVQYADNATRRMVAGRGIGEVPLVHKSKLINVIAPFQVEVGNLWHVMGDFSKEGGAAAVSKLTTLFVANWLMNQAAEKIRGSPVTFDPIRAAIDAYQNDDAEASPKERAIKVFGRAGGEILSNLPFGQTIANSLFTEEEGAAFFGDRAPTRFGSPLVVGRAVQQPLTRLLPPFGGLQAEKTTKGLKLLKEGGQTSKSGKTMIYDAPEEEDLLGQIQAILFGPSATQNAQEYFDGGAKGYERKIGGGSGPVKPSFGTKGGPIKPKGL